MLTSTAATRNPSNIRMPARKTKENWCRSLSGPDKGDLQHGFSYLSSSGRLVIKDAIMMAAALVTMADSAKSYLRKRGIATAP